MLDQDFTVNTYFHKITVLARKKTTTNLAISKKQDE